MKHQQNHTLPAQDSIEDTGQLTVLLLAANRFTTLHFSILPSLPVTITPSHPSRVRSVCTLRRPIHRHDPLTRRIDHGLVQLGPVYRVSSPSILPAVLLDLDASCAGCESAPVCRASVSASGRSKGVQLKNVKSISRCTKNGASTKAMRQPEPAGHRSMGAPLHPPRCHSCPLYSLGFAARCPITLYSRMRRTLYQASHQRRCAPLKHPMPNELRNPAGEMKRNREWHRGRLGQAKQAREPQGQGERGEVGEVGGGEVHQYGDWCECCLRCQFLRSLPVAL